MNDAARCSVSVAADVPFRAIQVGDTLEWTLTTPAVKALGRPAFIHRYHCVFALLPLHSGTWVADRCTRILEFHSSPNTPEP